MSEIDDFRARNNNLEQAFRDVCLRHAVAYGETELLNDAVDYCQDWAFTRDLIDRIGQDRVQAIMAEVFSPYRRFSRSPL